MGKREKRKMDVMREKVEWNEERMVLLAAWYTPTGEGDARTTIMIGQSW